MPIDYGSVCSGIEAATAAWHPLGLRAAWFAEIEAFPSAVLAHHYPNVPNLGDMTKLAAQVLSGKIKAPAVLVGGTPCFTAGHLVLTENGYFPIEIIKPGDMVMTHLGRLRRVVRIGSKQAGVGLLKAVGLREPLTVTSDHPFLAVDWRNQGTKRAGQYARIEHCGKPAWVAAKDMPGHQWCALTAYECVNSTFRSSKFSEREAMYVAGMYLGDGHIRRWGDAGKKALVLSLNEAKLERLKRIIGDTGFSVSHERTTLRATICDTALCEWLDEQFGRLSHLKRIPAWVLGHAHRSLLLQGYLDTDGTVLRSGVGISTVSRSLAYGVADLLNAEGRVASVGLVETPDTCVIEGRTVNQRDWYQVRAFDGDASRKSRTRHGYLLRTVQSYTDTGIDTVFNIEVEVDNSYVINGAVVHNCQAFSVAGMREGLADPRGALTIKYVELADAIDHVRARRGEPEVVTVWENVPGVLSDKGNAFGCFLGALAGEDCELQPSGKRWTDAGCVYGPKRTVAWRILDAQYFGLAQRRRRVFVVASARRGFDPLEVLFEREGVRRDSAPRRGEGQDVACTLDARAEGGGFPGTDGAVGGHVVSPPDWPLAFGGGRTSGSIDVAACLVAKGQKCDFEVESFVVHGTQDPDVLHNTAHPLGRNQGQENAILAFSCKDHGADAGSLSPTLRAMNHSASHANAGGQVAVCITGDVTHTLKAEGFDGSEDGTGRGQPIVAAFAENSRAELRYEDGDGGIVGAISAGGGKAGQGIPSAQIGAAVRRLTPKEAERLQGFPDEYTLIPWRGKPAAECPDGPRYKAIGNSKAVRVVRWIGRRILEQL